jgi:hypothetical protein
MIEYKKPLDKFGYTEFIDERGLTPKSRKRKDMHESLSLVEKEIADLLLELNVKLFTNSSTIVSNSYLDEIEDIVTQTKIMWEEVSYPFLEQVFIRTGTFENRFEFSLPSIHVDNATPKAIAQDIKINWTKLGNPDQIILHPKLSESSLKDQLGVIRFKSNPYSIEAEVGFGGVRDVRELEIANNIYNCIVKDSIQINIQKEDSKSPQTNDLENILKASKIFIPFIEKLIVREEHRHKSVVVEFQILKHNGINYLIFTEIEVV